MLGTYLLISRKHHLNLLLLKKKRRLSALLNHPVYCFKARLKCVTLGTAVKFELRANNLLHYSHCCTVMVFWNSDNSNVKWRARFRVYSFLDKYIIVYIYIHLLHLNTMITIYKYVYIYIYNILIYYMTGVFERNWSVSTRRKTGWRWFRWFIHLYMCNNNIRNRKKFNLNSSKR